MGLCSVVPGAVQGHRAVPWHREQREVGILVTLIWGKELERRENVHPLLLTCTVNYWFCFVFFSTVQVSPTFPALFMLVDIKGVSAFLGHVGGHITGLDHVAMD